MSSLTDREILDFVSSDRRKAFELAFNQYWEKLYNHACKKLNSEDLAKDMVQETFTSMWKNLDKLSGQDQLLPYLYVVLRNLILNQYAKDEVRLKYATERVSLAEDSDYSAHQILVSKELQHIIDDVIKKMPLRMKEIYILKREDQLSIREIAENLGLSEQTVKNQLQSASHRLKTRIIQYDSSMLALAILLSVTNF